MLKFMIFYKQEGVIIKIDNINGKSFYYETFKSKTELLEYLYCVKEHLASGKKLLIDDVDKRPFVTVDDIKCYNNLCNPALYGNIEKLILELSSDEIAKNK